MKIHHSGGISNLPIRAKLRDYKWHRPRCTRRISFFHAIYRTQMTTKEGHRLKETQLMGRVKNSEPEEPQSLGLRFESARIEFRP